MWVDQLQGLVQEFSVEGLYFDTVEEHKSRSLRDVRHLFDFNQLGKVLVHPVVNLVIKQTFEHEAVKQPTYA